MSFSLVTLNVQNPAPALNSTPKRANSCPNIRASKERLCAIRIAPCSRRANVAATSGKVGAASTIDAVIPCTPALLMSRSGLISVSYSSVGSKVSGSSVSAAISTIRSCFPKPVVSQSNTMKRGVDICSIIMLSQIHSINYNYIVVSLLVNRPGFTGDFILRGGPGSVIKWKTSAQF